MLVTQLAGCSLPGRSAAPHGPATLNWFINAGAGDWLTTLDPATVADITLSAVDIQLVNAGLVRLRASDLKVVPDLATWTVSADRMVWTFHIRPGARFSNGDRVTAEDAAWSLARALLPATKSSVAMTYLGHIVGAADLSLGRSTSLRGVTVLDPATLQIQLDAPVAYFLPALSYDVADVLDQRVMMDKPADSYLTDRCAGNVGAGPFRLVCRSKGTGRGSFYDPGGEPSLDFEPNPFYYGSRPSLRIHAPFISSEEAWRRYMQGRLDGVAVPSTRLRNARRMPGFTQTALPQTDFLTPNVALPPFRNVNCRLAVSYAIDRRHITSDVLAGAEGPLHGIVPLSLGGYLGAEPDIPFYDPSRARSYLARCPGHLRGVELSYDSSSPDLVREYRAVRNDLWAIGARVSLRPMGFRAWINVIGHPMLMSKPPALLVQNLWIADYPDPQDFCEVLLHSGSNFDIGGFSDAGYDRLVDEANVEPSPSRRAQLYRAAQRIALGAGASISMGYARGTYLVNPVVHGLVAGPGGVEPKGGDWSKLTVVR